MRAAGVPHDPPNRFEPLHYECTDAEGQPDEGRAGADRSKGLSDPERRVELLRDPSRTIVATNTSPDISFDASVNPYRGCEHACVYCYARPTHEYLGFSAGRDFETRILVKERAPELLRQKLSARSWRPQVLAFSGVTDCYQPAERKLEITRRCLQVLAEYRNPVTIVTKSRLVARDVDVLTELAEHQAVSVSLSVTTLDATLQHRMEPGASVPGKRLSAVEALASAGIPVGVMVAPVIPGLNDHEIPAILEAAASAGAGYASLVVLRLPEGLGAIFDDWLERHYPERRAKIMNRVKAMRGGRLYDARFKIRQRGTGFFADQVQSLFDLARRRAGLRSDGPILSTAGFRRPGTSDDQLGLFD
ncbi:MAG: PA0069 family radical SAM protein [Myxococcota bacterium]|nr:PA0069 family radical SAM protein [Myxococcota bacterium]